jgi:hypothetical protein
MARDISHRIEKKRIENHNSISFSIERMRERREKNIGNEM